MVCSGWQMPEPVLRNSPLSTVVCEVRFDSPSPDAGEVVELAAKLQAIGLTEYAAEEGLQVAVQPGELRHSTVRRHRFFAPQGVESLTLDVNTVAYGTAGYAGVDAFLSRWEPVAHALVETLDLRARTRIGLRYVNELPLADAERETVERAVNRDLLPPWGAHEHLNELSVALQELRFVQSEGELAFRHGLQRRDGVAAPVYLLDFDHYEQRLRSFDVASEAQRLRDFNATVYDVFRWSVTDEQYQAFEPEERPDA
jgi:uncharacterized protein (TIGR04255 family)